MTDLRELYPVPRTVPFGSGTAEVKGLSLREIAALVHEYHELIGIFSGNKVGLGVLLVKAPDAALAIFAFGYVGAAKPSLWRRFWLSFRGQKPNLPPDDPHQAFDKLGFGQQADILGAIYDLTLGGERAGPFVASLASQLRVSEIQSESSISSNDSQNSTISSEVAGTEATSEISPPAKPEPATTSPSDVSSVTSD